MWFFVPKLLFFFTLSWIYPPLGTVTIYRERFIDFIKRFVFFARDYRTAKDVTSKHSSSQSLWDNHVRWFGTKCVCLPYIFVYTFGSVQISCLIVSFCTLLQWWPTKEHTYTIHHTPTNHPVLAIQGLLRYTGGGVSLGFRRGCYKRERHGECKHDGFRGGEFSGRTGRFWRSISMWWWLGD